MEADVQLGVKEPFTYPECPELPRRRAASLVSGYSSAAGWNGAGLSLLPDLGYLGDVIASSVHGVFTLLLRMCVVEAFFL